METGLASNRRMKSLAFLFAVLLLAPLTALPAGPEERPTIGAIRWDGWYGTGGVVNAVEASLGPPRSITFACRGSRAW